MTGGMRMNRDLAAEPRDGFTRAFFLERNEELGQEGLIAINFLGSENLPETGEARLMRAVLGDALKCLQKYSAGPGRNTQRGRIELQAVQRWFAADDDGHALSFVNVCTMLGLDPRVIRSALDAWQKKHGKQRIRVPRVRRSSQNGRGQPVAKGRS